MCPTPATSFAQLASIPFAEIAVHRDGPMPTRGGRSARRPHGTVKPVPELEYVYGIDCLADHLN